LIQAAIEQERRMTKARTVGAKRRGRPRKEGPRQPNGEPSRIAPERRDEAQRTVAIARCNLMCWWPSPENQKRALADHMGCTAGRALEMLADAGHEDVQKLAGFKLQFTDIPELWAAVEHVMATHFRYWKAIGAPAPYANGAWPKYINDALGTAGVDVSRWDDRSDEEKVKSASNAMMWLEQQLRSTGYGVATEVKQVVLHDAKVLDYAKLVAGLRSVMK
jgi:hypothetical protein